MAAAKSPAFIAPALPIANVATGMPPGICTVESSASRPFRSELAIGTPRTGSSGCAVRGDHARVTRGLELLEGLLRRLHHLPVAPGTHQDRHARASLGHRHLP